MERQFSKPVEEGAEYDITIEAVGEKGDGIAKVEGFVIFVPGTKEGDKVKVKVEKVLRKFAIGKVIGESEAKDVEVEEAPENPVEDEPAEEATEEAPAEEEAPEEEAPAEEATEEAPEEEFPKELPKEEEKKKKK